MQAFSKIAFLENQDDGDLLDEEAREENFVNDITYTEPLNLKVETIPVTVNKETIVQQNTESSITSMGKVFLCTKLHHFKPWYTIWT